MAHPYSKFARFVRRRLCADKSLGRGPNYQWCLHYVSRYVDEVEKPGMTNRQTQLALLRLIQPIARVTYDAEEGFPVSGLTHMPD